MLKVNNFGIVFGKTRILQNVSFEIKQGEIVTLLGQSGCGKTTILRAIAGLHTEHEGEILIKNKCVSSQKICLKERKIGYIFQDYALFPHLNVAQNIGFSLFREKTSAKNKKVDELLEIFNLQEHKNKAIHQLSGGQQQRVAIARAMANEPEILLLDEPFANLDENLRFETKMWLKKLIKKNNISAILVTHDKDEALSISDKIGIIAQKELKCFQSAEKIFADPKNLFVANFLLQINTFSPNLSPISHEEDEIICIKTKHCHASCEKNDYELVIEDIYFCGDYYEILAWLKDDIYKEKFKIPLHEHLNIDKNSKIYLHFDEKNLLKLKK